MNPAFLASSYPKKDLVFTPNSGVLLVHPVRVTHPESKPSPFSFTPFVRRPRRRVGRAASQRQGHPLVQQDRLEERLGWSTGRRTDGPEGFGWARHRPSEVQRAGVMDGETRNRRMEPHGDHGVGVEKGWRRGVQD